LAQDFVDAATSYGKIIISEHFLPHEKKTIQPQMLPGIIGGEKFVVHNILFKFAVDHKNIYGSDFSAAKAAGNELRGLMCYFNTSIPDLNVPLMALVDYRGFRLTAMSLLPVDTNTIIYGTFDAGRTIHYSQDDSFNTRMKNASEIIRLRPHICRQQTSHHSHTSSPAIEAPQGFGRLHGADSSEMGSPHRGRGFEGFALYERERTPLLLTGKAHSKVRSHGATEELQLVTTEGTVVRRTSFDGVASSSSPSSPSSVSLLSLTGTTASTATSGMSDMLSVTTNGLGSPSSSILSHSGSTGSQLNMNVSFNNQLMYSPVDLEGHKGLDGKFYLLDFSRVLPPESPNRKFQNPHLSRLLRPEFLKAYDKLLCSDAFSGFIQGTPDEDEITADIHEATRYLRETHIPKMAMRIGEMMREFKMEKPLSKFRLTETLHSMGINIRYAGILRKQITDPEHRHLILAEVVARAIKNNLRWRLREQHQILKLPLEEPYLRLVIDYLNLVFGNTLKSDEYWDTFLKKDVTNNFEETLSAEEESPEFRLKLRSYDSTSMGLGSSTSSSSSHFEHTSATSSRSLSPNGHVDFDLSLTVSRDSEGSSSSQASSQQPRRQESPLASLRVSSSSSGSLNRDSIRSSASPISPSHHHPHRRHGSIHRPVLDSVGEEGPGDQANGVPNGGSVSHSGSGFLSSVMSPLSNSLTFSSFSAKKTTSPSPPAPPFGGPKLDHNFLTVVFERVKSMMGLQFTHDRLYSWEMESPFNDTDLKNVGYKVKHMNIISHVQGFFWQINGLMARSSSITGLAQDYYKAAIDKYEEALDLNPENKDILRNLALTWLLLIEEGRKPGQPFPKDDRRVQKVQEYIMRAISAPPKYDSLSLFRYANLLSRCDKKEEAEDYYLQSLEADPNNTGCLHEYGDFLSAEGLDDEAEQFYRRSSETTAGAQRFPENYY
jgi:hypothetical protein